MKNCIMLVKIKFMHFIKTNRILILDVETVLIIDKIFKRLRFLYNVLFLRAGLNQIFNRCRQITLNNCI